MIMIQTRVMRGKNILRRKTMKNKIICLIFAMVLAVSALVSCGGGGETKKDPNAKLDWDKTTLLFQMNMSSNAGELTSGVKRYYAGEDDKGQAIDELVSDRNSDAETAAKVDITYTYLEDGNSNYVWGANTDKIFNETSAGGQSAPDMYCNFAYDMTCAAIKGAFANLYSTSKDYDSNGNTTTENYFRFTEPDYNPDLGGNFFNSAKSEGYFKAYMDSLSLSSGKSYCLASDYCTDLVRSFLVIPVNISLLGEINPDNIEGIVDTGEKGYDTTDFYNMVWNNEWTYDMLAALSNAIYENTNPNDTITETKGISNLGDRLGFAAGTGSGITGSGLLYTTDVKIIDKANVSYPSTNDSLNNVAAALAKLFGDNKNNGICTVSTTEVTNYTGQNAELYAIRDEFASKGNILFGGIIGVGSLEDSLYQKMNANGGKGFGIVPVPLYEQDANKTKEYKTLVHNIAKIIGISAATSEFEMCTAFLNEVSTNSADVLEEYYTVNLAQAVGGGVAGDNNVKMLEYIRNHVNDCFDKTYDDVVRFYKESSNNNTWHNLLQNANYQMTSFQSDYGTMKDEKNATLQQVVTQWSKLPD